MKKLIFLLVFSCLGLSIQSCTSDSGGSPASEVTSGTGTVNIKGSLNQVRNFGADDQKLTGVYCISEQAISFAQVSLNVKGKSKSRSDVSEAMTISFPAMKGFPQGRVDFTIGNSVSYLINEKTYQNSSSECGGTFSKNGKLYHGEVTCKAMARGDSAAFESPSKDSTSDIIDLNASFDCSIREI